MKKTTPQGDSVEYDEKHWGDVQATSFENTTPGVRVGSAIMPDGRRETVMDEPCRGPFNCGCGAMVDPKTMDLSAKGCGGPSRFFAQGPCPSCRGWIVFADGFMNKLAEEMGFPITSRAPWVLEYRLHDEPQWWVMRGGSGSGFEEKEDAEECLASYVKADRDSETSRA